MQQWCNALEFGYVANVTLNQALDWLVSYYWEPQDRAVPIQTDQAANLRKEIKRRLREVALCLKAKQTAKSVSTNVKGKGEFNSCFI